MDPESDLAQSAGRTDHDREAPAHAEGGDGASDHGGHEVDPVAQRIVIVGGGFGGIFTARHLERLLSDRPDIEIVLISIDNYFLMTPLLFEACSGTLQLGHCSLPIREFLHAATFVEAMVTRIDVDRRVVTAEVIEGEPQDFGYDQLVLALGSLTNDQLIPGSRTAFTFKTLADAIVLRNHLIERFERADVERNARRKQAMLTIAIVGGGLVGVELLGELTSFVDEIVAYYPHIGREAVRFLLLQHGERILPEIDPSLAEYAHRVLADRPGVEIRVGTAVSGIEPRLVHVGAESIEAETIVLCAGVVPHPIVASLPLAKDRRGRVSTDGSMRCVSHPGVWAVGNCASIPAPDGEPYPTLAQRALREAKVLAWNIRAVMDGESPRAFVFDGLGTMAALGHHDGIGRVMGISLRGFLAWWVRRTYYLLQMPDWSRRMRIVIDWTVSLFFRPDIVKLDMAREATVYLQKSGAAVQAEVEAVLECPAGRATKP